jgi:hypothetical protein
VNAPRGAYGLRLSGLEVVDHCLVAADPAWPAFRILVEPGPDAAGVEHVDEASARIRLRTGGWIEIDRGAGCARFSVPRALSSEEIVHPYLAPVAAVTAQWYGRESLHGGGIALAGAAWGVLGERHEGKSTLLAAAAARGLDVVADDVLVVEGDIAFAGPRTVDLRRYAAEALGLGDDIGVAGARPRWRLALRPVEPSLPLAGWVFAAWGDEIELARLAPSETLVRLLRHRGLRLPPADPAAFVQLSALPAWEFRRPRSWDALSDSLGRLVEALAAAS